MIKHLVLFSAKDKKDIRQIINYLEELGKIDGVHNFSVKENLKKDKISENEIDIILYTEFENETDLEKYKQDEIYENCIKNVRPLRDKRIVVDF